ncbi:MAG TPA: hypothetical protein VIY55_12810 [Acetobacteraceae bacterium]
MRRVILLVLTGFVAGCVDQLAARQAYLSRFIGQPEVVLVQQMGVPARTYATSGMKYLAYDEHQVDIVPAFPSYSPFFTGWYGGGFPPQVIDLQCETTFEVSDGTVRSFTLRGNACG